MIRSLRDEFDLIKYAHMATALAAYLLCTVSRERCLTAQRSFLLCDARRGVAADAAARSDVAQRRVRL